MDETQSLTVEKIFELLDTMVDTSSKARNVSQNEDLRDATRSRMSEKVSKVSDELSSGMHIKDKSFLCDDHVESYLHLMLWLLNQLNDIIEKQMEVFRQQEQTNLSNSKRHQSEHAAPKLSPDVLSVGHQALLGKVYQFVTILGIIPHLPAGVGVPISSRSKYAHIISTLVAPSKEKLRSNTGQLLRLIKPTNVRSTFMAKHIGDLLAALTLLSRQQLEAEKEQSVSEAAEQTPPGDVLGDQPEFNFRQELDDLITKSYAPLIVRELMILQSGGGPKTPSWLRAMCGHYLTKILVSVGGVKAVIGGMITSETDDWRKFQMVGGVIATPPKGWSIEDYYQLISPQVLCLLREKTSDRQYSRVCAAVLCAVQTKHKQLMYDLFWSPLTADLRSSCSKKRDQCVTALYKVVCCAAEPQSSLLSYCGQSLREIFTIYLQNNGDKVVTNDTRLCCEELLAACLQHTDSQSVSSFLNHTTYNDVIGQSAAQSDVIGGMYELGLEERRCEAILYCISKVKESPAVSDYFVMLLQRLTSLLNPNPARLSDEVEHAEFSSLMTKYRIMTLLASLCETQSKACLKNPQHIVKFVKSSLEHYLTVTDSSPSGVVSDDETLSLSLGLLTTLMSGAPDVQLSESDISALKELNDPLNKLSLLACVPHETRELALNIRVAIATQGIVWMNKAEKGRPDRKDFRVKTQAHAAKLQERDIVNPAKSRALVEEISTGCSDNVELQKKLGIQTEAKSAPPTSTIKETKPDTEVSSDASPHSRDMPIDTETTQVDTEGDPEAASTDTSTSPVKTKTTHSDTVQQLPSDGDFRQAMEELSDHLIAVKGHALIQLTKLIQRRDAETADNRDILLDLLIQHLAHSDTYIYLSAINALIALADTHAAEVLPAVSTQYRNKDLAAETRLKIGEVITKATRCLGDMAPAYADTVLPTILIGCQSEDDLLRASSLVNLGELCKLLKYSMGNNVNEIVECLTGCLTASCQSSRRASAHSISTIISGLADKSFEVLGGANLSRVYKSLKSCAQVEIDDVTLHHCAVAISTIDGAVKNKMYDPRREKMEKRIYVLDAPPQN